MREENPRRPKDGRRLGPRVVRAIGVLGVGLLVGLVARIPVAMAQDPDLTALAANVWTAKADGGPTLLLIPQRSVPMFSCTVLVPSGSSLESPETSGAAHFLEHLLFNGTTSRTREEISDTADRLGAYNNASTQRDRTVFQLLLPSENWRAGLELQADMLLNSTLPESMFEKEKGILLEELAKDVSDPGFGADRFEAAALWGTTSRSLPVLGTEASIRGMDRAAVERFYRQQYRAAGMTLILMGDYDLNEVLTVVADLYGTGDAPSPLPARPPFPTGRTIRMQTIEGLPAARYRMCLPLPALTGTDFAAARMLENLLNGGEKTAISRAVEAAGFSPRSAYASIDAGEPWSTFTIFVDLGAHAFTPGAAGAAGSSHDASATDGATRLTEAILSHLAGLVADPPDADHFRDAWRELRVDEISLREKMHYYGLMRADVVGYGGPAVAIGLLDDPSGAANGALLLARAGLASDDLLVTITGASIPTRGIEAPAAPSRGGAVAPAPAFEASGDATAIRRTPDTSVARHELANGMTVITQASPDSRTFAAQLLLRERGSLEERTGVPRGTSDVVHRLMELGTTELDEDALRGRLASLAVRLKVTDSPWIPYDDYYFTPEYSFVRVETIDEYWEGALSTLAQILRTPTFEEAAIRKAIEGAQSRARKQLGSAREIASAALFARGWSGHPLAGGVFESAAALGGLAESDLRRHHAAMIDPANLILVLASDVEPAALLDAATEAFAGLERKERAEAAPCRAAAAVRAELEVGQEQSWIVIGVPLVDVPAADRPALTLAASILSERLAGQLRESEGLAYSIGASARLFGAGPALLLSAGTRPENLDRMEAGMRAIARTVATNPPTPDELDAARNRREGRVRMRRLSRMGQAYSLAMAELRGHDPAALDADLPALHAVTPDDIARVAARWFKLEGAHVVVAR